MTFEKGIGPTAGIVESIYESSKDFSAVKAFNRRRQLELIESRAKECLAELDGIDVDSFYENMVDILTLVTELHDDLADDWENTHTEYTQEELNGLGT